MLKPTVHLLFCLIIFTCLTVPAFSRDFSPLWTYDTTVIKGELIGSVTRGDIFGEEKKAFEISLQPGQYEVAGWVDIDIVSLKLTVYNQNGRVVGGSDSRSSQPIFKMRIDEEAKYKILVEPGKSRISGKISRFAFAIAKGSNCFTATSYPEIDVLDSWTTIIFENGYSIKDFAIIDYDGTSPILMRYHLTPGEYTAVAESSHPKDDLDMYVKIDEKTRVGADEEPYNFTVCDFTLRNELDVTVELDIWELKYPKKTWFVILLASK